MLSGKKRKVVTHSGVPQREDSKRSDEKCLEVKSKKR